jgi:hypothetical protein
LFDFQDHQAKCRIAWRLNIHQLAISGDNPMRHGTRWWPALAGGIVCYCVLSFYQTVTAQNSTPRPTLANAPESRQEMLAQLVEIKNLLKEQNALLKSGQAKVIVVEMPKK